MGKAFRLHRCLSPCLLGAAALLLAVTGTHGKDLAENPVSGSLEADLQLMMQWFPGEYDNNEQVWQQRVDGVAEEALHEHIHHIFLPVDAPQIGENIFFVKQYMDGDYEDVYRQRLYRFTTNEAEQAIELTIYRFRDEQRFRYMDRDPQLAAHLSPADLGTTVGCEVYWQKRDDHFHGYMHDTCTFKSRDSGKTIRITDTLKLTESEIWIGDKAFDEQGNKVFGRDEQHKNRKVRYFGGWFALKRKQLDDTAAEDDWVFARDLRLHNEGDRVPLVGKDGTDTGYSVELARLTYQNTSTPILKLGLIDNASGNTVTYIWSETDSEKMGLNLRWVQVGLTAEQ